MTELDGTDRLRLKNLLKCGEGIPSLLYLALFLSACQIDILFASHTGTGRDGHYRELFTQRCQTLPKYHKVLKQQEKFLKP